MNPSSAPGRRGATLQEIREIVGDVDAAKLEAILATGATAAEVEQAVVWAAGTNDVMGGEMERPLSGRVATVYGILMTEAPPEDRD
jgi:hypothetical protein